MSSHPHTTPLPVFSSTDETAEWFEPLPGERMRVRIGSEATGGRLTLLENIVAPGAAAPMHFHYDADELFIVLAGRFSALFAWADRRTSVATYPASENFLVAVAGPASSPVAPAINASRLVVIIYIFLQVTRRSDRLDGDSHCSGAESNDRLSTI